MAEEGKQETKKSGANKIASILLKVALGLAFMAAGVALAMRWLEPVVALLKGGIVALCFLAGLITLAIAKE